MRKTIGLGISITVIAFFLITILVGCETPPPSNGSEDDVEVTELKEITDPDGVVLSINSMPVTKAELEKWVKKIAPKEDYGLSRAFQGYLLHRMALQKNFSKEIAELTLELEKIRGEIDSGEISFEDAVMKYSDDPTKEKMKGLTEFYTRGLSFYSIDKTVASLAVGEISDPISTPMGCVIIKLEKEYLDFDEVRVSTDIRQIILSFDRFFKEDEDLMMKMQEMLYQSEVELVDLSLKKEIPRLELMGRDLSPEEGEEHINKIKEMEEPETNWRDLDPDIVVAKIADTEVFAGELKKLMLECMPPESDVYNVVITRVLLPRLSKIGYLKEYHEPAIKELGEIRDKIVNEEMTFEEAQIEYSDDPDKENSLIYEDIGEDMFIPEFEDIMFDIPFNEISEPFLSEFGVHILKVEDAEVDEEGNRTTVDIRHVLLDWKHFIDPNDEDPNAMYKLNLNYQKDLDIQVFDARLQAMLPGLGKLNEKEEEMQIPEPVADIEETEGTEETEDEKVEIE